MAHVSCRADAHRLSAPLRRGLPRLGPACVFRWLSLPLLLLASVNGQAAPGAGPGASSGVPPAAHERERAGASRAWLTVGGRRFAVTLAGTAAARALVARLPLRLDMQDLHGNEKKHDLPYDLPAEASRPGTIRTGDLLLWGSRTVVVFYKTFDSPYAYTRLGRVDDPAGLTQALGPRDVTVVLSLD